LDLLRNLAPGDTFSRTVIARNTSAHEAGSIHDDAVAARAGYRGGLVPGVTLLAYLTPVLIDAVGAAWPQRGHLRARFLRPAYDGERLTAAVTVAQHDGDDISLDCTLARDDGAVCVEATASCAIGAPAEFELTPWRRGIPAPRPQRAAPHGGLPPLDVRDLVIGEELSPLTCHLALADTIAWALEVSDDGPWYRDASPFGAPIVHPAYFARDPIALLRHNFAYKPIIHTATEITYRHEARVDRDYTVYGYIADVFERNGHGYVVVDTLTVDQDGREIARGALTAVAKLRGE
jgi:acyl-CoA thioesterase FadM